MNWSDMKNPFTTLALAILLAGSLAACCQDKSDPVATPWRSGCFSTARSIPRTPIGARPARWRSAAIASCSWVTSKAASSWIGAATTVTDLQGKRVLPGLHDAHVHPVETIRIDRCDLENAALDLAQLAAFVAACVDRLAVPPGEWLS